MLFEIAELVYACILGLGQGERKASTAVETNTAPMPQREGLSGGIPPPVGEKGMGYLTPQKYKPLSHSQGLFTLERSLSSS